MKWIRIITEQYHQTQVFCSHRDPAAWGLFSLPSLVVFTLTVSQTSAFSSHSIFLTWTFLSTVAAKSLAFVSPISLFLCLDDLSLFLLYLCDQSLPRLPTVLLSFFCGTITWKVCRMPSSAPSCPSAPIPHHNLLLLLCGARQWVCSCFSVPSAPFLWWHP